MERIYQNCRIRYTLRQEGGKRGANYVAAPGSRVQGAEKWATKQKKLYEIFIFSVQKKLSH